MWWQIHVCKAVHAELLASVTASSGASHSTNRFCIMLNLLCIMLFHLCAPSLYTTALHEVMAASREDESLVKSSFLYQLSLELR